MDATQPRATRLAAFYNASRTGCAISSTTTRSRACSGWSTTGTSSVSSPSARGLLDMPELPLLMKVETSSEFTTPIGDEARIRRGGCAIRNALVIGAGPAGSVAALVLARAGIPVTLVAPPDRTAFAIGEGLPPAMRPVLAALGLEARIEAQGHRHALGNRSAWGSERLAETDFIMHPFGHGWHLDRRAFDRGLLDAACEAGAIAVQRIVAQRRWRTRGVARGRRNRRGAIDDRGRRGHRLQRPARRVRAAAGRATQAPRSSGRMRGVVRFAGARCRRHRRWSRPFVMDGGTPRVFPMRRAS